MTAPRIIDISPHQQAPGQPDPDWRAIRESGVVGVYLRAFEGKDLDPTFETNRREALDAGLLVGAYQYLRARHRGAWQAEQLLVALGDLGPGELPPAVDCEELDGRTVVETQACLLAWLERARWTMGAMPVVYTYPDFWQRRLGGGVLSELARYDLWIAHYGVKNPTVPRPWGAAVLWQFEGDAGRCAGVQGPCDRNVWTGAGDFEAWAERRC